MSDTFQFIYEPCPFCNSKDVQVYQLEEPQGRWYVFCNKCFAKGPVEHSGVEAVEAWGTRIDDNA